MRIHVADTSNNRGQYDVLLSERFTNSLGSYAYRTTVFTDQTFPKVWNGLAKLQPVQSRQTVGTVDLRARVIIDSGAFTAFTTGKVITPKEYAAWSLNLALQWRSKLAAMNFMNLDVIGDQNASWQNQYILEKLGMNPIPIITFGAEKRHLIQALDNYEYIGLGGLVPWSRQKEKLRTWLDYCYALVMPYYHKTGVMPKIHLLGMTSPWLLQRYPVYSSDSSSWTACFRFPDKGAPGITKPPMYKASAGALAATLHSIRFAVRKMKETEQDATKLWALRGIQWID